MCVAKQVTGETQRMTRGKNQYIYRVCVGACVLTDTSTLCPAPAAARKCFILGVSIKIHKGDNMPDVVLPWLKPVSQRASAKSIIVINEDQLKPPLVLTSPIHWFISLVSHTSFSW